MHDEQWLFVLTRPRPTGADATAAAVATLGRRAPGRVRVVAAGSAAVEVLMGSFPAPDGVEVLLERTALIRFGRPEVGITHDLADADLIAEAIVDPQCQVVWR